MDLIKEDYEISLWEDKYVNPFTQSDIEISQQHFYQQSVIDYKNPLLINVSLLRNVTDDKITLFTQLLNNTLSKGYISFSDIFNSLSINDLAEYVLILPKLDQNILDILTPAYYSFKIDEPNEFYVSVQGQPRGEFHLSFLNTYGTYSSQISFLNLQWDQIGSNNRYYQTKYQANPFIGYQINENGNCGIILKILIKKDLYAQTYPSTKISCPLLDLSGNRGYINYQTFPNKIDELWISNYYYSNFDEYCEINNISYNVDNILQEQRIISLGSTTSTSPNRTIQPKFTDNLNGSHTLTFTLYDKYIDSTTNEKAHNPYIDLIKNESKIKLRLNQDWYDFIVKQINSSSDKKSYTYTCKDQYINELSKQGYDVEFDTELMNNIDTADNLAATAIVNSGWEVDHENFNRLIEYHIEPLVKYISDGYDYYVPYIAYQQKSPNVYQWKYVENEEPEIDEDYVLVTNVAPTLINNFNWEGRDISVTQYYGKVPQNGALYQYDPLTHKVVQLYEEYNGDEKVKDFYAFTENEFISPTLVSNYAANGENFSSTSGWCFDKNGSVKLNWTGPHWWTKDINGNGVEYSVLTCRFPNGSYLKNSGIESNFSKIKSFHKGEKYVLRIRASRRQLESQSTAYRSKPNYDLIDRHIIKSSMREIGHRGYYSSGKKENHGFLTTTYPLLEGNGLQGKIAEYTIENGQYKIKKVYANFGWAHEIEYYCSEDFPIGPAHQSEEINYWSDDEDYGGNQQAYIKDSKSQIFKKQGTDEKYLRFAFFTDMLKYGAPYLGIGDDRHPNFYGMNNPLYKNPKDTYTSENSITLSRFNKQAHNINNEVDTFYIPIQDKLSNYCTDNSHYKYMVAEIQESITEKDLREKQIGLFILSNGPYGRLPKLEEHETYDDYGNPEIDPNGTNRLIQDINIENVQLFPFKTKKANFVAYNDEEGKIYSGKDGYIYFGWSTQWHDTINNVPVGKTFLDQDELILPETAPDSDLVNRTIWKCYDPISTSIESNEFSVELTEFQVSEEMGSMIWVEGDNTGHYEQKYPYLYNLSIQEFGNKFALNDFTNNELANTQTLLETLLTTQVLTNTPHITIQTESNTKVIKFTTGENVYLSQQEYDFYIRLNGNGISYYEPKYETDQATGINTLLGYGLISNQSDPSYLTSFDNIKNLIVFNSEKYTSTSFDITLDSVDYFYSGTLPPEEKNPNWRPKLNTTSEKYRMITANKSNYFDILQKICESFECWMDFRIGHESNGALQYNNIYDDYGFIVGKKPAKTITIKEKRGHQNYAQFRSAINLKDSTKNSDTNNFATHLIVENNSNEFGIDGFCSIARAETNPLKENYLFNFDYYTKTNRIDRDTLMNDLYGSKGYYTQVAELNEGKVEKLKRISSLLVDLTKLEANADFYQKAYDSAQENALNTLSDFNDFKSNISGETDCKTVSEGITRYKAVYANNKQARSYGTQMIVNNYNAADYLVKANYWKKQYNTAFIELLELQDWQKKTTAKINELTRTFYNKYQTYIADATWSSNDYTNDDLYYLEAQRKLASAAKPKVTYTFSVISLDKLPGYEGYKFEVGDRVEVIDTDFFGYETDGITPKKVEVIVTELTRDLDNPDKTIIKVQTYQDNFTSLFQRITASVNQLK